MKTHKIKVKESGTFILCKGVYDTLFLFDEEHWYAFFESLDNYSSMGLRMEAFKRVLMRDAIMLEIDDDLEVEIPEVLWNHLTYGKEDVEISVKKVEELPEKHRRIAGEYGQWVIQVV